MKKFSVVVVLSMIISLFTSVSAMAAESVVLKSKGGSISITNVIEKTESSYDPIYVVKGSTKVTINNNTPKIGGFHFLESEGMSGYSYYPNGYFNGDQLENWEDSEWVELSEKSVTLNKKGVYRFDLTIAERIDDEYEGLGDYYGGSMSFTIVISDNSVKGISATPTNSKITVNGKEVAFEAYTIDGSNYFKLRDLAAAVSGTEKPFNVSWDSEHNAIRLTSGQAYKAVGGELSVSNNPSAKAAQLTNSKIIVDGEEVQLTAYNIGNSNYFKLRDIADLFNIGVTWNGTTKTVGIDTRK